MSALSVTLSLLLLPVFWIVMSWFGRAEIVSKHPTLLQRASIFGTVILFVALPVLSVIYQGEARGEQIVKLSTLNGLIVSLVVFIGVTLIRFSRNYMIGEPCYPAFFRWMKLTLAAVVVTLMANHLVLLWLGWLAISLSLHRLLLLYPERPRAVLAAHKKFIIARCSELTMLIAFIILYHVYDTAYIDTLSARVVTDSLSDSDQLLTEIAAVLMGITALLKCAQLPFHGWLIKIVEAPTPVSALLHAGIINLGGYLLLLFAPLLSAHSVAQWVVLVGAGMSTFCAALIMTTRVSIKVRLAWSTTSQMGMMLIECALGLYSLAVLHLLTHSLYKAYAFLNSGNAVYDYLDKQLGAPLRPTAGDWANAALISLIVVCSCIWLSGWQSVIAPWVLLGCALTSFLAFRSPLDNQSLFYLNIAAAIVLAATYTLGKTLMDSALPAMPEPVVALSGMDLWITLLIVTLYTTSVTMQHFAHKKYIQRFRQALFAGLYLDEWFTRMTLKLWPVVLRKPSERVAKATITNLRSH